TISIPPGTAADGATSLGAHLFRCLACDDLGAPPARFALAGTDRVTLGRGERGGARDGSGGERRLVLRVPDPHVSSTHAELRRAAGLWLLEDAGSKNGTFVDGERIERHVLRDGERVEIGRTFFLFRNAVP